MRRASCNRPLTVEFSAEFDVFVRMAPVTGAATRYGRVSTQTTNGGGHNVFEIIPIQYLKPI